MFSLLFSMTLAYLTGSVSSAILISNIMKLPDPRSQGSHNPGATNVLRLGGKKAAFFTLIGDTLKGLIPVLLANVLGFQLNELALIGLAAFLGHLWPIFFQFRGGKGVATTIGVLFALSPATGCAWAITWLAIAILFRYSSLAAIVASFFAPLYLWYFTSDLMACLMIALMSLLLIYRHQSNLLKLWQGNESQIGQRGSPSDTSSSDQRG